MRARRTGALVVVGLLLSTAGCAQLLLQEETEFVAEGATLEEPERAGYTHNASEWQNVTRSVGAAGQEREVTVSNRAERYVSRTEDGTPGAAVTVVSSPGIRVAGEQLSPVADWSQRDLLLRFSEGFDPYGNVTAVEERETEEVRMLGTESNMRVFNATLERDDGESDDVVVSVVKVRHEGDFVVAIGVRGMHGADLAATNETLVQRVDH